VLPLAFTTVVSCDRSELTDGPKLSAGRGQGPGPPPPPAECEAPPPPNDFDAVINEVMVENTSSLADETGAFPPWLEIHNPTDAEINLGRIPLSDDLADPTKWEIPCIPEAFIPPGGFVVIFLDGDTANPNDLHANFTLTPGGFLQLALNNGSDLVFFDASGLASDFSAGRSPDGDSSFVALAAPTPGAANSAPAGEGGGEEEPPPEGEFVRGDVTADERVSLTDMLAILGVLFRGEPPPACRDRLDANDSGGIELTDVVYLGNAVFQDGPRIPPPFPQPGIDPTTDGLPCPE
jgi:hypothetical protein